MSEPAVRADATYDAVVVGTSFASSFFLHRYLARSGPGVRVLVLERGEVRSHAWQMDGGRGKLRAAGNADVVNRTPDKRWVYLNTFGGGSNCWFACTPRMLPDDFRLRSRFGQGADWPVAYDELEPYYCDAEDVMQVAGPPADDSPFPRSRPYPQPPHQYSNFDRAFKQAYPNDVYVQPAARPTRATANRPVCCANRVCYICPIDSKFTVLNELHHLYHDPRVTLVTGAAAQSVEVDGGTVARGVRYLKDGREEVARGDFVALGANALFNPHILLRSGLDHPELGRGLQEQVGTRVILHLDGIENLNGTSWVVGHWYGLHGRTGDLRSRHAGALVELGNHLRLRQERGKWRQVAHLRVIHEDLRRAENRVTVSAADPTKPELTYVGHSEYAERGRRALRGELERLLAPLPVEGMWVEPEPVETESHIMGTTVMGNDPRTSVVDRHLLHHRVRNLAVLGSSTFPHAAPANPTLTIAALSLRTAAHVTGGAELVAGGAEPGRPWSLFA